MGDLSPQGHCIFSQRAQAFSANTRRYLSDGHA